MCTFKMGSDTNPLPQRRYESLLSSLRGPKYIINDPLGLLTGKSLTPTLDGYEQMKAIKRLQRVAPWLFNQFTRNN